MSQDVKHSRLVLTEEARSYLDAGSPEAQLFRAIDADGTPMADLKVCGCMCWTPLDGAS